MNTNVVTKTDEKKKLNFFQVMKNKIFGGEADNSMINMILIGVGIFVFLILVFLIYKKVTSGGNGEDSDTMSLNTTPRGDNDSNDSSDNN